MLRLIDLCISRFIVWPYSVQDLDVGFHLQIYQNLQVTSKPPVSRLSKPIGNFKIVGTANSKYNLSSTNEKDYKSEATSIPFSRYLMNGL